jgi:hypothetical protein
MFNEFFLKCYDASVRKGFYESPPTNVQVEAARKFLRVIREAAVEFENVRKGYLPAPDATIVDDRSATGFAIVKTALLATEVAEMAEWALAGDFANRNEGGKPEGYLSEGVDVLIRLGDQFGCWIKQFDWFDFDMAVAHKLAYNESRPHKNGKQF